MCILTQQLLRKWVMIGIVLVIGGCNNHRPDQSIRDSFFEFYGSKWPSISKYASVRYKYVRHETIANTAAIAEGEASFDHWINHFLWHDRNPRSNRPDLLAIKDNERLRTYLLLADFAGPGLGIADYRNGNYKFGLREGKALMSVYVEEEPHLRKPALSDSIRPVAAKPLGIAFKDLGEYPHFFQHFGEPTILHLPGRVRPGDRELVLRLDDTGDGKGHFSGTLCYYFDPDSGLCTGEYFEANGQCVFHQCTVTELAPGKWQVYLETFRIVDRASGDWVPYERYLAICEPLERPNEKECWLAYHGFPEPSFSNSQWSFWWIILGGIVGLTLTLALVNVSKKSFLR